MYHEGQLCCEEAAPRCRFRHGMAGFTARIVFLSCRLAKRTATLLLVFSQQAPLSLDGHNNSAELSSILGRDSFAALFSVSENTSFFTRLVVVNFGIVVLVTVHWNTMVYLSHSLCVTSPSKLQLGVLKSVVGFAAIAVAMLLTLAIFVCFQFCGYGGGRSPGLLDERLCPAGRDGLLLDIWRTFSSLFGSVVSSLSWSWVLEHWAA